MIPEKVSVHIVEWLKSYATKANVKGFVVGVSGGIDSSVTATLCARTGLEVLLVELPINQHKTHVLRGKLFISKLTSSVHNVTATEFNLDLVFNTFKASIPMGHVSENEMPYVNTRARLRMTALYYLAASNNLLVAGTGNKIEDFGIGFFTKYGDGGVDLSPIADLIKSDVYSLGKYLEIPEEIISAPPTDGLWGDDRTDEDQIGASYPELEWAMTFETSNQNESELTAREAEVLSTYRKLNKINQHKMNPIPVCIIPKDFLG